MFLLNLYVFCKRFVYGFANAVWHAFINSHQTLLVFLFSLCSFSSFDNTPSEMCIGLQHLTTMDSMLTFAAVLSMSEHCHVILQHLLRRVDTHWAGVGEGYRPTLYDIGCGMVRVT